MRNAFSRTRADHAREVAEDYVELIDDMGRRDGRTGRVRTVDLERALGVSQPTVTKTLRRLEREGLLQVFPREGVELTDAGRTVAVRARERHAVVEDFLLALGVPPEQARLDAEGLEHHASPATLDAMRRCLAGGWPIKDGGPGS